MKKAVIFLITMFCSPLLSLAQETDWQKCIGGNGSDYLQSIIQTSDGGYLCGGYSASGLSGSKTEISQGSFDYWVIKLDLAGNIEWQNTVGGVDVDILNSVYQTPDGSFICGGYSRSGISGDKTEYKRGSEDYWIVKLDASGVVVWQKTIGGSNSDMLYAVSPTNDGGMICGGSSSSNANHDKTEVSNGFFDYWIVKLDSSGSIQWQNSIGGNSDDQLRSISQTADGGYFCGGYSRSGISGDKTEFSNNNDYWVLKLDSVGNIQWQNTIGGNNEDYLTTALQTPDGGFICGGYSNSNASGDKTKNSKGGYDFWIVKLDNTGNIEWENTIGGSGADKLHYLEPVTDGGYICGGNSESDLSGDKHEYSLGAGDYWVVKIDSSGNPQWQNSFGGSEFDYLFTGTVTADGKLVFGGNSDSGISGDKTSAGFGSKDYWIVRMINNHNLITGSLYADMNQNLIHDPGEPPLVHKTLTESNTGQFAFTNSFGNYTLAVNDTGNFSIYPSFMNFYNSLPIAHTANFTLLQQKDSLNDFAFQPAGNYNDLCVQINPAGAFRPGFTAHYIITYENRGTTVMSPDVLFFPDNAVTYAFADVAPGTITPDSVIWNPGPLAPFQSGTIHVTVNVSASVTVGTIINSGARIEPVTGDANPACNVNYWEIMTTGSFDPNDISVNRDTLFPSEISAGVALEYLIRFQNTGNDTAFFVSILNPVDTSKLQLNTFEFVSASHPLYLNWNSWESNMHFQFDNILLPDSQVNQAASHGYIRYRILPKPFLIPGDSINNHAAIYFDFNAPVITNFAITKIELPTGYQTSEHGITKLLYHPNPATEKLTINFGHDSNPVSKTISVFNVMGHWEVIPTSLLGSTQIELDISFLPAGIYLLKVDDENGSSYGKFVKQ